MRLIGIALIAVSGLCVGGCGGSAPSVNTGTLDRVPERVEQLMPEGASLLVSLHPRRMRQDPALREMVESISGPGFLASIEARTGVDLLDLERLALGVYGDDTLVIGRSPHAAADIVTVLGMRMNGVLSSSDSPPRRVGFMHGQLWHAAALNDRTFAVAIGDGEMLPELFARVRAGRWEEGSRGATQVDDVQRAVERHARGPVEFVLPEPLQLPENSPIGLVLAQERAMSLSLRAEEASHMVVEMGIIGEFPEHAERNLRQWVSSMAETELGTLLGLQLGIDSLRVQVAAGDAWVQIRLPAQALSRGLRVLFGAELEEITDRLLSGEEMSPPAQGAQPLFDLGRRRPAENESGAEAATMGESDE